MSKVFTIMDGLENMGALRTGGQGSVYKGRRIGPILSAVKLLPTPIANESLDDKNYRNFINEVEKLKKVNEVANPNVVKILSSGITESGSLPFIEMEFIEGPDLAELLAEPHEKIFTIKETIKLADQLAGALAHCHKVGVKHGDIKSNNVKFNVHTGNYVLLDFGLSIMSDEERRSSMRHAGAIEFMAPEQNEGKMLFQTDIYGYGVVLYELLAGTVPFPLQDNGETARNTVMISHMEAPVPDLLAKRQQNLPPTWSDAQKEHELQVPVWLLNIIYKCLEKLPENRFANGMDLQEAIVRNSVSAGNTDNNIVVLKTENEILQTQLLQLQEAAKINQKLTIPVARPLFNGAIAVIAILACLSIYGLFSKKVVYQPAPQDTASYVPFIFRYKPVPTAVAITYTKDSVAKARKLKARTAVINKSKHRRKKFLGIF
ncbi:serine/threonine-protein kinase [Mucilaginibacter sp. UR6-11]|uniref:serine/threonine protein kinase n=1 Tax=Mucilaginibacter sp. UR6-11 TaxID=1435644 RepID=UPI001E57C6CA|nr:serine/threonine-protein kinase [Mucilaginibacter sp. UR6-11]MCC8426869.1 serine/threonine protein kinase [Mucilaginibacter sp. UR6-11]